MSASSSITLFCLPYAGGSAHTFGRLRRYLDLKIEIVSVDPPGHGERMEEPLIPSYEQMADDIYRRLREAPFDLSERFAFYGHSMGASLAFLIIRRLEKEALPLPLHLFVSGSAGPAVSPVFKGMYRLAHDDFLVALKNLGGIRSEHLGIKGLLDLFLPVLRSDLRAASDFDLDTEGGAGRLSVPVTVFLGRDDLITRGEPNLWQTFTSASCSRYDYAGKHFFFLEHLSDIAEVINNTLKPL